MRLNSSLMKNQLYDKNWLTVSNERKDSFALFFRQTIVADGSQFEVLQSKEHLQLTLVNMNVDGYGKYRWKSPADRMKELLEETDAKSADVVALQEVENRFLLQEFVDTHLSDMGYQVVLVEGNDSRGIDCALQTCPGDCSGNGWCRDGKCLCYPGFGGSECAE